MLIVAFGIAIIACVGFWMVGGVLLRAAGLVVAALAALNLALVGNAAAILLFVVGLALWLVGHWHYALRHHEYKSPLARRFFYQGASSAARPDARLGDSGRACRIAARIAPGCVAGSVAPASPSYSPR